MDYVLASNINKHCQGLWHLAVSDKAGNMKIYVLSHNVQNSRVFLHVIVPHLHELLLPRVDIREVVNHLAGLDPEPLWVRLVLFIFTVEDCMRLYRQVCGAAI